MASGPDPLTIALAGGVLALFAWYFWHVGASMLKGARVLNAWFDGRAERQRAALDHEARFGPTPLWLKAVRFLMIASLIALLAAWFWFKTTAA